jgi:hypothetical protein
VCARELEAAGRDWTEVLAEDTENQRARLAAEILASAAYQSTGEKVRASRRISITAGDLVTRRAGKTPEIRQCPRLVVCMAIHDKVFRSRVG